MKYLELMLTVPHEAIDLVTAELMEMGITATQVVDHAVVKQMMKKQHAYDWDYIDPALVHHDQDRQPALYLYFDDTPEGRTLMRQVREHFSAYHAKSRMRDDSEWKFSYREHFKTHSLTNRIVIKPTWESAPKEPDAMVLELDPGMAFGTGDHETTSMCARLMEERGCFGKDVLDVGTGSGILSIAAALMGARTVLGMDIDPVAVQVARDNVKQNHCDDRVEIREGDFSRGFDFCGDLIVANLVSELVCRLASQVSMHLHENGSYICSGILIEKKQMVREALCRAGLTIVKEMEDGDWCAIEAINA